MINGKLVELKSLTKLSKRLFKERIHSAFRQSAQVVLIDGRIKGLNSEDAIEAIERARGTYISRDKILPGIVNFWTMHANVIGNHDGYKILYKGKENFKYIITEDNEIESGMRY